MHELHQHEQYFYDEATLDHLANFLENWSNPCCICAPMLGKKLVQRDSPVTILDIDERFADLKGFRKYDIYRPQRLEQKFDLILCDPPFTKVSLSQLFAALRILSQDDFDQPILISFLASRMDAVVGTFAPFGITPTGYLPKYRTVRDVEENKIEMFGNLSLEQQGNSIFPKK